MNETYKKLKYPTPNIFKNKHKGAKVLIIGTGNSTRGLIKFKKILKNKFDVIIGLNFATIDFENEMDYHMVLEKNPVATYQKMKKEGFDKSLPRILNFKSLKYFPKDINIIKATRTDFGGKRNIRLYENNNFEGFMNGPTNRQGLSTGSVALHGIHFAGILGCSEIYLCGVDLVFDEKFDHYYKDRFYRNNRKETHKSPIIKIKYNDKTYETTEFFRDSAYFIDDVIKNMCVPEKISVYTFSDGLLKNANRVFFNKFFV